MTVDEIVSVEDVNESPGELLLARFLKEGMETRRSAVDGMLSVGLLDVFLSGACGLGFV